MPLPVEEEQERTDSDGGWVNPYGVVAVALVTLSIVNAVLVGGRLVTFLFAVLALLVVALGFVIGSAERERKDLLWFAFGSVLSGLVLFVMFTHPEWLNPFWGLDVETKEPNSQQLIAVPRKQPYSAGKRLTPDDWVDASKDAIRQDKVLVRIESVKRGSRGIQVHLQIANFGNEVLKIAGFGGDKPVLTDSTGRSFAFLKPQMRIYSEGPPRFEDIVDQGFELQVDNTKDYLLLFETPPNLESLKLEVPALAWGRQGRCQFDINGLLKQK